MLTQDSLSIACSTGAIPGRDPYVGSRMFRAFDTPCDGGCMKEMGLFTQQTTVGRTGWGGGFLGLLSANIYLTIIKEELNLICMNLKGRFKEAETRHNLKKV